MAMLSRT